MRGTLRPICLGAGTALAMLLLSGCSESFQGFFRHQQGCGSFRVASSVRTEVDNKIDLLFVVDNSDSMANNQTNLTDAFNAFSSSYLRPNPSGRIKDIRIAAITTDTYKAGSVARFNGSEDRPYPLEYAGFSAGYHDGPRPLWTSSAGVFTYQPGSGSRASSPLLTTVVPGGVSVDDHFTQLNQDFRLIAMPGTNGFRDESATSSLRKLIEVGEKGSSGSKLFRANSTRAIFLLTDAPDTCAPNESVSQCSTGTERMQRTKAYLDSYFRSLDGLSGGSPNYFVIALHSEDDPVQSGAVTCAKGSPDTQLNGSLTCGMVVGYYEDLVSQLKSDTGNFAARHSLSAALGDAATVQTVLNDLGEKIEKVSSQSVTLFDLPESPAGSANMQLYVSAPDGTRSPIPESMMRLSGNKLQLDAEYVSRFPAEATIDGCWYPESR